MPIKGKNVKRKNVQIGKGVNVIAYKKTLNKYFMCSWIYKKETFFINI